MTDEAYIKAITKWRQEMDTNLRRENGWLALAGLFWLRKGVNTIGSDSECDILLPQRAPANVGNFVFDGNNVTLTVELDTNVEVNGVQTKIATLDADEENVPSFISFNEMRMVVVRRGNRVGIRLWDNTREERRTFPPRNWYPLKEELRRPANYVRFAAPKIVDLPDILGASQDVPMHGYVTFELGGATHQLIVTEEPDHRLFIQFMDTTNGDSTYPSGRYHYTNPYDENQAFYVDFNKAYNLPCAFTKYATCTFPPPENHLGADVEAGEMYNNSHY